VFKEPLTNDGSRAYFQIRALNICDSHSPSLGWMVKMIRMTTRAVTKHQATAARMVMLRSMLVRLRHHVGFLQQTNAFKGTSVIQNSIRVTTAMNKSVVPGGCGN